MANISDFVRYLETQERPEFLPRQLDVMGLIRRLAITNPMTAARELPGKLAESRQMLENYEPGQQVSPELMNQFMNLVGGFAPMGITAYHGSPYLFRQFDPAKVGTGEGVQAYGVGAGYTAEARPVAQRYAEILANRDIANQNRLNPHANAKRLVDLAGDPKYAADDIRFAIESNPDNPQKELLSKTLDYIESGKYAEPLQTSGYLYKGDIPDEILSKFLDWDKPIKKQPNVMAALRSEAEQRVRSQKLVEIENEIRGSIPSSNFGDDYLSMFRDVNVSVNQNIQKQAIEKLNKMDLSSLIEKELESMKPRDINWNMTGKDLYEFLAKNQGSAEQATTLLDRNGIRGIRYLDQASRGEGKGTSNFIPFRPEDFKIQEINDIPIQQYIEQGLL